MIVKIAVPVRTIRQKVPLPRLLVRTAALLNFQSSSLPLPNPVAKIVLMVITKPPLAKTTVIRISAVVQPLVVPEQQAPRAPQMATSIAPLVLPGPN